ncbi:MAG: DUF1801 domain-containing protein [Hyphomicrobiales bacterium]|nr:DUF1801 domain-containing protein [Hyphomicrobiales bacterium]
MTGRSAANASEIAAEPFDDEAVAAVFGSYPARVRGKLLGLRSLIVETAAATPGVGRLMETLKWGQPSYLTPETKSGTTIRIDAIKGQPDRYALYVHCQTKLIETYREIYPDRLAYQGNRAVILETGKPLPVEPLRHCIALALTYHANKKK